MQKDTVLKKGHNILLGLHAVVFVLPGSVVDERILEQREEDESDAEVGPDVDGLGVCHWREGVVD